jgi:hypothetical protein
MMNIMKGEMIKMIKIMITINLEIKIIVNTITNADLTYTNLTPLKLTSIHLTQINLT